MGQCVSRQGVGSYAPIVSSDSISVGSWGHPGSNGTRSKLGRGHSESKGAKKRTTPRGVATSFGFRKRPASSSRIPNKSTSDCLGSPPDGADNELAPRRSRTPNSMDKNGNGGSPVTSGRSTPLARPRKNAAGAPPRTNSRFGFRQSGPPKTAKVGDVPAAANVAEQAFKTTQKEEETINDIRNEEESKINNNPLDKFTNKNLGPLSHPITSTPTAPERTRIENSNQPVRTTTKQTVILTYSTQQYTTAPNPSSRSLGARRNADLGSVNPRSKSAGRASPATATAPYSGGVNQRAADIVKYRLQTTQLPKPQFPAVTVLDSKTAKQVANNSRKVYGTNDHGINKNSSVNSSAQNRHESGHAAAEVALNSDDGADEKPRRPRNLEMVMRNAHSFHLRELQVTDLDILDEAVVTDNGVIPLPKLPSALAHCEEVSYPASKAFEEWQASREATLNKTEEQKQIHQILNQSTSNKIEELHKRLSAAEIHLKNNWMSEEKGNRDRIQHEKKAAFLNMSAAPPRVPSPLTRSSSKESSPSSRSEELTGEQSVTWARSAGEAMARRSQDDISTELSISSCDDDRPKNAPIESKARNIPQANISIIDSTFSDISKPIKFLDNYNSEIMLPSMLMSISTMSGSTFSNTSATMTNIPSNSIAYLMESSKLDLAALETSTHSMIDDETSPVDSLISSSSDSNNDLANVEEKEQIASVSSSAYQTANTKTKSTNINEKSTAVDDEILENLIDEEESFKKSKDVSPETPGTPTNASNSLSLSEGRDFLIDDEIADQPGLVFENNSIADHGKHSIALEERDRNSPKKINSPLLLHKKKVPRTPSLDTLSSIGSDDLMMDLELGRSITSLQSGDDCLNKMDDSLRSHLSSIEDSQMRQDFELPSSKYSALKHWNHLLDKNCQLDKQLAAIGHQHHLNRSNSTSSSSLANIGASLPARAARLLSRSRADASASPSPSPSGERERDVRLDRQAHASMLHDVVAIKTLLLRLKRVLQEPDEEDSLSTETLDPLSSEMTQSNGLFLRLAESQGCEEGRGDEGDTLTPTTTPATPTHQREELADLRRQIVFLQSQLEDRERVVKRLQEQMSKCEDSSDSSRLNGHSSEETCNVATQTERLRPLSTGGNLLQNITDGRTGLVSWSEQKKNTSETSPMPSRLRKPSSQVFSQLHNNNYIPKCQCMTKKLNGHTTNDLDTINRYTRNNSVESLNQVKANGRVGSRYLQAIAGKQLSSARYMKREVPSNDRALRSRSLYGCRSKSIDNVNINHTALSASNTNLNKRIPNGTLTESASTMSLYTDRCLNRTKHNNSYSDLMNEMLNGDSREIISNGYCHNGNGTGQSTDTDDNSDSGYKSLPPVLNLAHNKISGIPRRSDIKYISTRSSHIY